MNYELLDTFGEFGEFPEELEGKLETHSWSTVAALNRRGSVLAIGCNDGRVFIWDFWTRGIAKVIQAHQTCITSVSWSRNGKLLATASNDGTVNIWDVLQPTPIIRWHLQFAITSVQFSPRNQNILLIHSIRSPSYLVEYSVKDATSAKSVDFVKIPHEDETDIDSISSFDRRGEYVFSGNNKGRIQVIRLEKGSIKCSIVTSFRVSNTAIKQIEFAPKKKDIFLVNSADRIIRVYNFAHILAAANSESENSTYNIKGKNLRNLANGIKTDPEPVQKLQDTVNKTAWKKCCFSGGAESDYVCAASSKSYSIYIWERNEGTLVKILNGGKCDGASELIWHPVRPIIIAIASGVASVWHRASDQSWSAYSPEFKELEENVVYEERESEFDDEDEDRDPKVNADTTEEEDEIIDVVTPQCNDIFISSDEEQEDPDALIYFPITMNDDHETTEQAEESIFDNRMSNVLSNVSNKEQRKRQIEKDLIHPDYEKTPIIRLS